MPAPPPDAPMWALHVRPAQRPGPDGPFAVLTPHAGTVAPKDVVSADHKCPEAAPVEALRLCACAHGTGEFGVNMTCLHSVLKQCCPGVQLKATDMGNVFNDLSHVHTRSDTAMYAVTAPTFVLVPFAKALPAEAKDCAIITPKEHGHMLSASYAGNDGVYEWFIVYVVADQLLQFKGIPGVICVQATKPVL